ncbi:hypothetical protein QYE76_007435 [Lolium multiflorum]|uniref:Uncharacterized protein n=1 Tax=Lolium multiflorum TaxID=4521 RepID=A0AAD8W2R1_LOLMU|nr:hypothetical protein QYE76_007435 [Lolium multiflorum]
MAARSLLTFLLFLSSLFPAALSTTFTLTNSCAYTVWPGLLSSAGTPTLDTTGFALAPGESRAVEAPSVWSGRLWARTGCGYDSNGRFSCGTCDCGSGAMECSGGGAAPPCSLAEFTLAGSGGNDFYDVSLVDGYNIAMAVLPQLADGAAAADGAGCAATGCSADLNGPCPADLRVSGPDGAGIACKSACEALKSSVSGTSSSPALPVVNNTVSNLGRSRDSGSGWPYAPSSSHASMSSAPSPIALAVVTAFTWDFITRRHWLPPS